MTIKFVLSLSYYLAEECFKNEIIESSKFYFKTNEHTFILDKSEDTEEKYDLIELDCTNNFTKVKEQIKKRNNYFTFWYYGEGMTNQLNNWKLILDSGVKIYTSTWEPELVNHSNYVYDLGLSFHYFNFCNGSCYIDKNDIDRIQYPKKYKVGLYGLSKWKENSQTIRNWRNEYVDYFSNKSDVRVLRYERPSIFELSQTMRNQHFSTPYDFRLCEYFLTAETHFNYNNNLPYFTSEKILKSAWLEMFGINTMLITSPNHLKDLHDIGFVFSNSKFVKDYTTESIMNSLFECYETSNIIETNNLPIIIKILSENIFKKHNILWM